MSGPPPPPSVGKLEKYVLAHATRAGFAVGRVRHWVSFMMISAALDRASSRPEGPRFLVKGGVALELRLGRRARATDDIDVVAICEDRDLVAALDIALREPVHDFTFTRRAAVRPMPGGAVRVEVQVSYRSQRWATVQVDVTAPDGEGAEVDRVPAIPLHAFGLVGPEEIACLSLRHHVAQKFHGMTKRLPDGVPNDRFRDAVDLVLLKGMLAPAELPRVREACEETFRLRAEHPWPPDITLPEAWAVPFEAMARQVELEVTALPEAEIAIKTLLHSILTATEEP